MGENITLTTELPANSTDISPPTTESPHSLMLLLVPVVVFVILCITSIFSVYLTRKNRYDQLRHFLVPTYNFDPNEGDDWETDMPDIVDTNQSKKPKHYQTMTTDLGSGGQNSGGSLA